MTRETVWIMLVLALIIGGCSYSGRPASSQHTLYLLVEESESGDSDDATPSFLVRASYVRVETEELAGGFPFLDTQEEETRTARFLPSLEIKLGQTDECSVVDSANVRKSLIMTERGVEMGGVPTSGVHLKAEILSYDSERRHGTISVQCALQENGKPVMWFEKSKLPFKAGKRQVLATRPAEGPGD